MRLQIALSKLHAGSIDPRSVKATPAAHRRLVASIRAFGLLEPLVARPMPDRDGQFQVIAGNRRLMALRQIHRNSKEDPKISCEVHKVDDSTAGAISLSENFAREGMHPLDEAEAFARLATDEAKGAQVIASQFGVTPRYVRQRMKLAGFAPVVKEAFRRNKIDTSTAEAFSAVPEDRQVAIWKELNGSPRDADGVRQVIRTAWIDAAHALFDLKVVPELAVSRDLFNDRVLVERSAFMKAQNEALSKEQEALREDGWAEAIVGARDDIQDRIYSMQPIVPKFDAKTARKLIKLNARYAKLKSVFEKVKDDESPAVANIGNRMDGIRCFYEEVVETAVPHFSEADKAAGTAFLMLDPDGRVRRDYRRPRQAENGNGKASVSGSEASAVPTSEDLSDRQLALTFIHQGLAVRQALLGSNRCRKRILAMILHEKINSDALAIHHEANAISVNLMQDQDFKSEAAGEMRGRRGKLDPFIDAHWVKDVEAYQCLSDLSESRIDKLIEVLMVECLTTHLQRGTDLVHHLAAELKVNIRDHWRPDQPWLAGYQKIQLAHLLAELHGSKYEATSNGQKKSELVQTLANLFSNAADGKLEDKDLAERVNRWIPANLRSPENHLRPQSRPIPIDSMFLGRPDMRRLFHIQKATRERIA